jgi:hypothetical protein
VAFKVIEGGGRRPPEDFDVRMAAQMLRTLTTELLRAIARGNDPERRITRRLIELYKLLGEKEIEVDTVVNRFLGEAHSELTFAEVSAPDQPDCEVEAILIASLQVIAEKLCFDDAAQGRTSQRERRLESRLEAWLAGSEKRSRENGWSYLEEFLKRHLPSARRKSTQSAKPEETSTQKVPNRASKIDFDPHCAEAYERFERHEIPWDQLPPGRYPGGMRIYADGEWEALVRAKPMRKREVAALEAYCKAKGTVGHVKGGGLTTTERLAARGYVEIIQENGKDRVPYYGITPAGETVWHELAAGAGPSSGE